MEIDPNSAIGQRLRLDGYRQRRRARFFLKWAAIRGAVAAALGLWTGEYQIAAVAWAALTWFHLERVMETQ